MNLFELVYRLSRKTATVAVRLAREPDDLAGLSTLYASTMHRADGRRRQLLARRDSAARPEIISFDGSEALTKFVLEEAPPWSATPIAPCRMPAMISNEEKRYHQYIGRFYAGLGEAVELGPWLGASTSYILTGLTGNPRFAGRKLWVFDDFVWRSSWMDEYMPPGTEKPANHQDFRFLFEQYTRDLAPHMQVRQNKIAPYDGNENLPDLVWEKGPIEICYIDCGRTFAVNEAWFSSLSPHFIPGRTLLVMQDWQTYKEIPPRWINQTRIFTDSKGEQLELIHELLAGTIATFRFRG